MSQFDMRHFFELRYALTNAQVDAGLDIMHGGNTSKRNDPNLWKKYARDRLSYSYTGSGDELQLIYRDETSRFTIVKREVPIELHHPIYQMILTHDNGDIYALLWDEDDMPGNAVRIMDTASCYE